MIRNVMFASITPHERKYFGYNVLKFVPFSRLDQVDVRYTTFYYSTYLLLFRLYVVGHSKTIVFQISVALSNILQILAENVDRCLNALDFTNQDNGSFLCSKMKDLLPEYPKIKLNIKKISQEEIHKSKQIFKGQHFIIVDSLLMKSSVSSRFRNKILVY